MGREIPAYAGMTWLAAGMTEVGFRPGVNPAGQGIRNRASMIFAWLLQTGYYRRSGVVFPTFGLLDAAPHSTRITQGGSIHDCASRGW